MKLSGDLNGVGVIFSSNADVFSVLDTLERLVVAHKPLLGVWEGKAEHSYLVEAIDWEVIQRNVPVQDQHSFMLLWQHSVLGECCNFVNAGEIVFFDSDRWLPVKDSKFFHPVNPVTNTGRRDCTIDPVTGEVYIAMDIQDWPMRQPRIEPYCTLWMGMRYERKVKNKWK